MKKHHIELGTTTFSFVPRRMTPPFGAAFSWLGIIVWCYPDDL
jgi:hypothetical protein